MAEEAVLGVISDTHGSPLPREAEQLLRGVERILHAGDVDTPHLLAELELIAPVTAVRGNCDRGTFGASLLPVTTLTVAGAAIRMAHELRDAVREPLPPEVRVVVSGHTHVPRCEIVGGVLYLNPGSPSHARRGSGHHLALLHVRDGVPTAELLSL